ncbi:MAG: tRNA pseudouridine(55) synthase TruB [Gloeobacterales cyanobacterium]
MEGFLNLNKSAGMTSHDCVNRVRRLLKERRVGHGGTLDPAAVGVLPMAIGPMTRLLRFLEGNKVYQAAIVLGIATDTDDLEGQELQRKAMPYVTEDAVEGILENFLGVIEQIPPRYSAVRKDGKKLYELARAGIEVQPEARMVSIQRLDILQWQPGDFPKVHLEIECSSGTYVRSIARDLGEQLGGYGTLAYLVRSQSGGFHLDHAIDLEQIQDLLERDQPIPLLSPKVALSHLPVAYLTSDQAELWCCGQKVFWPGDSGHVQVWEEEDSFLGIAHCDNRKLQPVTVLRSIQ